MSDSLKTNDESATEPAAADVLFQSALVAHQAGRFDEAIRTYQEILSGDPFNAGALHLLGIAHQQTGNSSKAEILIREALALCKDALIFVNLGLLLHETRRLQEAEEAYRCALDLSPDFAEAHNNLGNLLKETGRLAEAETAYRRAVESRPDFAEAHNNLGNVLNEAGQLSEAEAAYRQALALRPGFPLAYCNLGNVLHAMQRVQEAKAAYCNALELEPDFVVAYNNLGQLLRGSKSFAEAEIVYRHALQIMPSFAEAHYNLANLLSDVERFAEAEEAYRRALELKPDYECACCNLGNLLKKNHRLPEAEEAYIRALDLNPAYAEAHFNLGNLYQERRCISEAVDAYNKAIALKPEYAEAYYNLGKLFKETSHLPEAEAAYRRALDVQPDFADARWNLSLLLLSKGCYAEAWQCYESRYAPEREHASNEIPDLPFPQWQGESLVGKSLVLCPEQGFGDYIQFVRYAPLLKERGVSRLSLVCGQPLKSLLETVHGVDAVVTDFASLDDHDYWSFPLSLPLHFGTTVDTIPAVLPYVHALRPIVERWRDRMPAGLKVGLAWRGSPAHLNDANRSLAALSCLAPLWTVPDVAFISLQTGLGDAEAMQTSASLPVLHLGQEIQDFADTAAIIAQLDLVVCVDTAIAHLAGALGKPCWVLLPAADTDWRWFLDRTDSPWYPGVMRLFRQTKAGDWSEPIRAMARELGCLQRMRECCPQAHVFFVHSPITYSMSLATISHMQIAEPILIGGRSMSGEGFACTVEDDGIWSIARTCQLLRRISEHVPNESRIAIYLPHTAFLFGKLVKISNRVNRIYYLEEGFTSAQAGLLSRNMPSMPIDLPLLTASLEAENLIDFLKIDRNALACLNDMPANFFDIRCGKYAGSFGCSPDAFPGMYDVTRLSLEIDRQRKPERIASFTSITNRGGDANEIHAACLSVHETARTMIMENKPGHMLLIKLHPRDRQGLPGWFYDLMCQLGNDYFDYCRVAGINPNIEPALLNFDHYYIFGRSAQAKYVEALLGADRVTLFPDLL